MLEDDECDICEESFDNAVYIVVHSIDDRKNTIICEKCFRRFISCPICGELADGSDFSYCDNCDKYGCIKCLEIESEGYMDPVYLAFCPDCQSR